MMNISRNFAFSEKKKKPTYGLDKAFGVSFFNFVRLVITVKTQAKRPSKSTFLPVSPPFANKVKNEIKKQGPNTKGCPKLYNSQNSWVGTTTSSNSQEGFSGFWQTRDEKRSSKNNKRTVAAVGARRCNDVSGFSNRPPTLGKVYLGVCCCLHIKPFFLPNDISSTPSVLPDSSS